jgi:hypothetical protein
MLSYGMPGRVFGGLVALALGYVSVMALAFGTSGDGMALVFVIFGVTLVGFYGLPWLMAKVSGAVAEEPHPSAWDVETASGRLTSGEAMAQVFTVPALMLIWAVFVALLMM